MSRTNLSLQLKHADSKKPFRPGFGYPLTVLMLILGAVLLAACSSGATKTASHPSNSSSNAVAGSTIVIKNFAFSPDSISVKPGATVTVKNEDEVTHTLTADSGAFTTGNLTGGSTMHFNAPTKPGSYAYRCSIHQFMTGTVVVT
jgi:plastocyanin